MKDTQPLIRNISDTARWVAIYRARETDRPDALFRDPFARRLAGPRGEEIASTLALKRDDSWPWTTRTVLFDRFIAEQVAAGADMVVNLAAGLDSRPYRMDLPESLVWVEVDLPELLDEKEAALAGETPHCKLERIRLDLANVAARRDLFDRLAARASKALVVTEGLLIYLSSEEVAALAEDLAKPAGFHRWVFELVSPGLLKMLQKKMGGHLSQAGAPLKFAPPEGAAFFEPFGWKPLDIRSILKTAGQLKRLPFFLSLISRLPEPKGPAGSRIWSAICLFGRTGR